MTKNDLINHCYHEGFDWAEGEHEGEPGIFVRWPHHPEGHATHVALSALEGMDWATVRKHACDGHNVEHVTRVVGYFSRTQNWNSGKLGELKDRQTGRYTVQ